jgi:hypothetical protein
MGHRMRYTACWVKMAADKPSATSWRVVLPLALAAVLVAVVLYRVDRAAFFAALARVSHVHFFVLAFLFTVAMLAADSLASATIYRSTVAPVGFGEFFVLRGASYLPSVLSHHLGQAFVTYFLARSRSVRLTRVAGATLLSYASWAACILLAGTGALAFRGSPEWLALFLAVSGGYLWLLRARPAWLTRRALFAPLFEVGPRGHLVAAATRVPHFLVLFFGTWASFELFEVHLPLEAAALYLPVLMVITTLPFTPQGLGTRDAFGALALVPFAAGATEAEQLARIGAATLTWGIGTSLVEAAFGLVFLRFAMRWLRPESREIPAEG